MRGLRSAPFLRLAVVVLLVTAFFWPGVAWARAGGGQHFSSSSSHSSSSYHSSSSGGWSFSGGSYSSGGHSYSSGSGKPLTWNDIVTIFIIIVVVVILFILNCIVQEAKNRRQAGDDWGDIISDFSSDMLGFMTRPKYGSGGMFGGGPLQIPQGDDPFCLERPRSAKRSMSGRWAGLLARAGGSQQAEGSRSGVFRGPFLDVVRAAFPAIQQAWSARNLAGARCFCRGT